MKKTFPCIAFTSLLFITLACKKNSDPSNSSNKVSPELQSGTASVITVEQFVNECEFMARSFKTAYPNQPGILSGTVITSGQTEDGKIKYDIVFNNSLGSDNKRRSGKLTVVFENAMENGTEVEGKHLHVRSDDESQLYTVDNVKFKGSLVYSNLTNRQNAAGKIVSHINAQSFLLLPGGEEIRFSSKRKSQWTAGINTTELNDDVFEISDQEYSLAITKSGTKFINSVSITPINLYYLCTSKLFTPTKGTIKVEHVGGQAANGSFGYGNCSDEPTILSWK